MQMTSASCQLGLPSERDSRLLRIAGVDEAGRGPLAGPGGRGRGGVRARPHAGQRAGRLQAADRASAAKRSTTASSSARWPGTSCSSRSRRSTASTSSRRRCSACAARVEGVAHAADIARIDGNRLPRGLPCPAEALDRRRRARPRDHGRLDPRQGRARPPHARTARAMAAVRIRRAQGLLDARPPGARWRRTAPARSTGAVSRRCVRHWASMPRALLRSRRAARFLSRSPDDDGWIGRRVADR